MQAASVIAVVVCVSFLDGLWTWLLASAVAEVAGQASPPVAVVGVVLLGAWLTARFTTAAHVDAKRRRWILAGGGLAIAFAAGTIQSGLIQPLQLVFGHYEPDYRGSGIVLLILFVYLWARGLQLSARVTREHVIGHIGFAASALATVLLFLPLTQTVQERALPVVVEAFFLAVSALFLTQVAGAQSRSLTRFGWASIATGAAILVLLAAAALTGVIASTQLAFVERPFAELARALLPVANVVLLAAGYGAQAIAMLLRWLMDNSGVDQEAIRRGVQQAEEARPQFDSDAITGAPEVLGTLVAVFVTLVFVLAAASILHHLVRHRAKGADDEVWEGRTPVASGLRDAPWRRLGDLLRRSKQQGEGDRRSQLRRHYRSFQEAMAHAGRPRGTSETALEYRAALLVLYPSEGSNLGEVTAAYTLARYAPTDAPLPDPDMIGRFVQELRTAARQRPATQ
ncbi:MAG: hypothetical protein HW416_218 [Chloroflexi bacterium]|nr:hypothetical protein [Chloroflexota bacterium]